MARLSVKGMAVTCGFLWGGSLLLVGLVNRIEPSYGWWYLKAVSSLYPGYHTAYGLKNLIVGVLYGLVDGAIAGALFAWVYNWASQCCCCSEEKKVEK
jgi:hypothetical protein